jgi:hypothetical protein
MIILRFDLGMEAKMERRYYLLKSLAIVIAVATATFTSGVGTTRMAHAINHERYSASAEVQAAAWRTTACVAHGPAHLLGVGATLSL